MATRVSPTQVNLAWTDNSTNETGFTVEQKVAGGPTFTPVADVPLRSVVYSVTSVPAGQAMTYRVIAFNPSGSATSNVATTAAMPTPTPAGIEHVHVAGEPGRTKGWPTNNGMWIWGNEIVVMYDDNTFRESAFTHAFAFDRPVLNEQARSLDGGRTWTVEKEPIVRPGAPGFPTGGNDGPPITDLPAPIDFQHPDFAMQVRFSDKDYGPSYYYFSYDRARTWRGPYRLPMFGYGTVNARNDYIVDGNRNMLLLLSGTPDTNDEGRSRPFGVRTTDGGMTWTFVAEQGPLGTIQPSTVRVSPTELVTAIRAREGILVRASTNNGASWSARSLVTGGNNASVNSPGSLVRLPDGRIVIVHGYRIAPSGIRARISSDNGRTWSDEVVVRQDGGSFDLGYTRAVLRPDGKIVAAYYFNGNVAEERTIEASIIDPAVVFPSTPPTSSTTVPVTTTTPPTTAAPTTTVPSGTTYLSDLQPAFQTNAVGPMERDRHNGGGAAGDGGPIVLAGRTYAKGLGTNAFAETRYNLGGRYTTFTTDVGIDDSCGNGGSADRRGPHRERCGEGGPGVPGLVPDPDADRERHRAVDAPPGERRRRRRQRLRPGRLGRRAPDRGDAAHEHDADHRAPVDHQAAHQQHDHHHDPPAREHEPAADDRAAVGHHLPVVAHAAVGDERPRAGRTRPPQRRAGCR